MNSSKNLTEKEEVNSNLDDEGGVACEIIFAQYNFSIFRGYETFLRRKRISEDN